uniref:DNA-3-methyladenine glycosylase II n=1 Tax=Oncorhynchus mykiss TaxID=8022 RepID=A0A8C7SYA0_ONCMY
MHSHWHTYIISRAYCDPTHAIPCLCCKVLVCQSADGTELRGRVVETERNTAMFMKPGTIYVYPIYGIYLCMNVSSQGEGAAVLLRALEPLNGLPLMKQLRTTRRREGARPLKDKELCNGPSKLCQALDIPRCFDRRDLASDPEVWLERDTQIGLQEPGLREVVSASRIGIDSHGEWATKPLRFYLRGHHCVSVVNKQAEIQIHSLQTVILLEILLFWGALI